MSGPETWGPHGWKFIHYVTLGYPENPTPEKKEKYKAFFILLKDILPCSVCANHYAENLKKLPITDEIMNDKQKLINWAIDMHNIVNEMKNKPILSHKEALKLISTDTICANNTSNYSYINEHFIDDNQTCDRSSFVYTLIILLIALITIALVYKKN